MGWLDQTDLILKASTSAFGEPCKYKNKSGSEFCIEGIFDNNYQEIPSQGDSRVQSTGPQLGVRLCEFETTPQEGETVSIRDIVYRVLEFKPDGQGGAVLILNKV